MQSPQTVPAELLSALSAALSELRATWYLFGAQATMVWGRPRLTADIDVALIRSTLASRFPSSSGLYLTVEASFARIADEADAIES